MKGQSIGSEGPKIMEVAIIEHKVAKCLLGSSASFTSIPVV